VENMKETKYIKNCIKKIKKKKKKKKKIDINQRKIRVRK